MKKTGLRVGVGRLLTDKSGGVYAYAGEVVSLQAPAVSDNPNIAAEVVQVEAEAAEFVHVKRLEAAKKIANRVPDQRSAAGIIAHKALKDAEAHAAAIEKAESEAIHAQSAAKSRAVADERRTHASAVARAESLGEDESELPTERHFARPPQVADLDAIPPLPDANPPLPGTGD